MKDSQKRRIFWNKHNSIILNDWATEKKVLNYAKELFEKNVPSWKCDELLLKKFDIKVRVRRLWKRIYSGERVQKHGRILRSLSQMGEKNTMKCTKARKKSSLSHMGDAPWNKGLNGDEYVKHYPSGFKGGGVKGFKHSMKSRKNMSIAMNGKKHNYSPSLEVRKEASERMKKQRQNFDFNQKMFKSLSKSKTKTHKKVTKWIKEYSNLKTESNRPFRMGNKYAEIDEADIKNKVAIFVDGNYWHNYPDGRQWDRCCTTYLENKGWKVLRFWESDINENSEKVIQCLREI